MRTTFVIFVCLSMVSRNGFVTGKSVGKVYMNSDNLKEIEDAPFYVALVNHLEESTLIGIGSLISWISVLTSCHSLASDFSGTHKLPAGYVSGLDLDKLKITAVVPPENLNFNLKNMDSLVKRKAVLYSVHAWCHKNKKVGSAFGGYKMDYGLIMLDEPFSWMDKVRLIPIFSLSARRNKMFLFHSYSRNRTCMITAFNPPAHLDPTKDTKGSSFEVQRNWQSLVYRTDVKNKFCGEEFHSHIQRQLCSDTLDKNYDVRQVIFTYTYLGVTEEEGCFGQLPYHYGSPLSCPHPAVQSWRIPETWYAIAFFTDNFFCAPSVKEDGGPYVHSRLDIIHYYLRIVAPGYYHDKQVGFDYDYDGPWEDAHKTKSAYHARSISPTFVSSVLLTYLFSVATHFFEFSC